MSTTALQIISFNSSSIENFEQLKNTGKAFQHIVSQHPSTIITCGSFAYSYKELIALAYKASTLSRKQIANMLQPIIDNHINTLKKLASQEDSFFFEHLEKIYTIAKQISALLHGISFIKEISERTITLLDTYGSNLAAILIQTNIHYTSNIELVSMDIANTEKKVSKRPPHIIIALPSKYHSKDHFIANLAITHKAMALNIWSQEGGVMSANPKIVPRAFPLRTLDYSTALEIGYLGGKILHPTAIQKLKEKNIPILLYSIDAPDKVSSTVMKIVNTDSQSQVFTITERDKLTILTIRSTKMFDAHGYLERLFKICSSFSIPVETLSTSEVSVTLTFPTKYKSNDFFQELAKLGDTEFFSHQTIVSIIGKHIDTNAKLLSKIFASIHGYTIHMISLGQSGSNLHLVFDTKHKLEIIPKIYKSLFRSPNARVL